MLTSSPVIETVRRPQNHRDYLVFVRAGNASVFLSQGVPQQRNWDLCLSSYMPEYPSAMSESADWIITGGLSKCHAFNQFLQQGGPDLGKYKAVWLVDEDIMVPDTDMVDAMFSFFDDYDIYIGQPSITPDSFPSLRITVNCPAFAVRFTNFVEAMMPIFSAQAIIELRDVFTKTISGHGVDVMWSHRAHVREKRLAVMDSFSFAHTRECGSGGFYRYLADLGVHPIAELMACLQEENISEYFPQTIGGIVAGETIRVRAS